MKTLVTGANGLLGANVVRELVARGRPVKAFVRQSSDLTSLQGLDIELFYGDLLDKKSIKEAMKDCRFVIHAAGMTPKPRLKFEEYVPANVTAVQHVVNEAHKQGIERMVFVSSCCVFGGGNTENPGTELSEFSGFRFNSGYVNSKFIAQQWVLSEVERKRLPVVVVNPTILLGPYDVRPGSGEIILQSIRSKYQLCPDAIKNFIDVRDAAVAICNALSHGMTGECYLLGSENLAFAKLFEKVNRIYGQVRKRFVVPGPLLKCAGLVSNAIKSITRLNMPFSYSDTRMLAFNACFSSEKAVRELGLPQHPIDDAVRDAIEWFAGNGYLSAELPSGTPQPVAA